MKPRSVGVRLTLWYFAILSAALAAFGAGMWFAMRQSLYNAVDETLRDRVRGVARFIEEQGASLSAEEMRDEFREHSVLGPGGDLFQVADRHGNWLYRSAALDDPRVPIYRPEQLAARRYENIALQGKPLRFLSQAVQVRGEPYAVQVAVPLHELAEGLQRFFWILLAAVPAIVAAASLGGYWLSRRALAPVDQITAAARSISAQSLSRRLPVPETGDELQRLSSTLNAMFERLEAAFARITRFTADASHELRTPIAFMRTAAELALRRPRSEPEYREALAEILAELERTAGLIEDLLLLARADSRSNALRFERIDLVESLREACERGKVLAASRQILFDARLPDGPVGMEGDGQAIRRLFLILIDNAVKYTAAGGQVRVKCGSRNGCACVEVRDSGAGISEQDLPHIFERFYRADKARSPDTGGAGLGLAIARWIVEAHRGEIEVESAVGRGSAFRVLLPLSPG